MMFSLALLAAIGAVHGSPIAFPQAVTDKISPSGAVPAGCTVNYSGSFGIAVMNVTAGAARPATTLPDGQPGAATSGPAPVTTIGDGQPQASTGGATPVRTISDGQPQVTTGATAVQTIGDGQPQVQTSSAPTPTVVMTMAGVQQISDGQVQGGMHTVTMMPVHQIGDGQVQNPTVTVMPVTVISDGQPQAPKMPTSTASAINTIGDGQPQVSTGSAVSTIADGQPQAPTGTAVNTLSDGQPQASPSATSAPSMAMVACKGNATLSVSLADSILTDNLGRIGYIASNFQFQFDGPPQAGALFTAGFSVCANGSLALGGSAVFYQCLSGDFYNLYDRYWAAQCSPITINVVKLIDCA